MLAYFINGLALGFNIGLLAFGLALIWRTAGMIDFSYGSVFLAASYATLFFCNTLQWPLWIAAPAAILVAGGTGMLLYAFFYRRFLRRQAPLFILVLLSLAIFIVTENGLAVIFGAQRFYFIDDLLPGWMIFGVRVNAAQITKIVLAVFVMAGLWWYFDRTRSGSTILAVADNRQLAEAVGINIDLPICAYSGSVASSLGLRRYLQLPRLALTRSSDFSPSFLPSPRS
jgi:branched-chain amino acid transport system permease protein